MNSTLKQLQQLLSIGIFIVVLLSSSLALADVLNGDFSAGGSDWASSAQSGSFFDFPAFGGNPDGYALLGSFADQGNTMASISQTFECGEPGSGSNCTISLDFFLDVVSGGSSTGSISVIINGWTTVLTENESESWETFSSTVPCGTVEIVVILRANGSQDLEAKIDNVTSGCENSVANEKVNFDTLKNFYR